MGPKDILSTEELVAEVATVLFALKSAWFTTKVSLKKYTLFKNLPEKSHFCERSEQR